MEPERWQIVEQLFHAALKRNPEERAGFLQQKCADDETLYKEVSSLLTSYSNEDSFFEDSASELAADMFGNMVGETIGPYEVLSELGSGGMGTVYLAQDVRLGRKIALKLLPPHFTYDKDRLRRFQQEARAASALNHPNILTVHEIEQRADLHYIATEFVDGMTLRQHMTNMRMTLNEVLNIAVQVASALHAAHTAGIAHRDIKPENVMIRSDGYVKVLDFGLAKLTEVDGVQAATPETNPGIVMGTPRYMSPEQARGLDVDARTDIFSLGIVIYEMVTGRVPFEGETTSDIIAALIRDEPEPMSVRVPELPPDVDRVVKTALAKDPDQRYQTIAAFSSDLQLLKDDLQLDAKPVRTNSDGSRVSVPDDPRTAASRRFRTTDPKAYEHTGPVSPDRTRWAMPVVLGVLLLVVAVVVIVSFSRRRAALSAKVPQDSHQITNRDGFISGARFRPNGKGIVFSAGFEGRPLELFFADDVQGSATRPAGIQSAAIKSVSSSGKIAVLLNFELNWSDGWQGTLAMLPAEGGKPEIVMEGVDEAAFAPDGNRFAIVRTVGGEQQLEYPVGQVLYKSSGWMSFPRFSPKGDKIAFFEHPIGDNGGSINIFDLSSQKTYVISREWTSLRGLAWNAKTNEIWFGGSRVGRLQTINAVSLSGELRMNLYQLEKLHTRIEDISEDGRLLVLQGINHSTMTVLGEKAPSEPIDAQFPWTTSVDLSDDGKNLLYYNWGFEGSDLSDVKAVYLRKLDGSPIRLGPGKALALSRDGKWALAVQTNNYPKLVLLSTSGAAPRTLPNKGIKEYLYASFFPDGRQILFTGVEARDGAEIRSYVQDVDTGEMRTLTDEWTEALLVSPDGKNVITRPPDLTYYLQPLAGGEPTAIQGLESGEVPIQWSDDSQDIYVKGDGEFATKIYRVNLASGKRTFWKDIDPANKIGLVGLDVNPGGIMITPDGKVCVYTFWTLIQQLLTFRLTD